MYNLEYNVTIGDNELKGIEKITLEHSQELLSHTCMIDVPGTVRGVPLQVEDKVKRGDAVTVKLGYDDQRLLKTEFTGYLKAIYPGNPMRLECEDSIYLTRRKVTSKILKNVTAKDILTYVLKEINPQLTTPFTLKTDISGYKWEKFSIHNATGYEVIDKLRKESGLTIYAQGNELRCHLAYTEKTGECTYDFERNIEATNDLKYVKYQDVKQKVVIVGRTSSGAKLEAEAGESGGDVRTFQRPTVTDKSTLESIAKEELKKLTYDGYRGSIQGLLIPYCEVGYSVKIVDEEYPEREGVYYALATKVEFSSAGGVRTVSLGAKLS